MLEAKASFHRELPEHCQMKEGQEEGRSGVSPVTPSSGSLQRTGLLTEVNTILFYTQQQCIPGRALDHIFFL